MELLHEKMYVIYYNCYTYNSVKAYVPRWVETDQASFSKGSQLKRCSSD